jgi:hypothetical protein
MVNPPRIDIDRLSEIELIDLNHRIVERLKMIAALRSCQQMMKFSVGGNVAPSLLRPAAAATDAVELIDVQTRPQSR